jgi:hypothetical protein
MQKVVWAKGVFLPFLFLLTLNLLISGCEANLFLGKMGAAEDKLSYGKPIGKELNDIPAILPPSVTARHKIALAIDSIIEGHYNYKDIKGTLTDIRQDPYIPGYLKVEAGYILVLVEKIERERGIRDETSKKYKASAKDLAETAKKYDKCLQEKDQMKQVTDQMKGELKELKYKLEKIEEIHIDIEKRRGMQ